MDLTQVGYRTDQREGKKRVRDSHYRVKTSTTHARADPYNTPQASSISVHAESFVVASGLQIFKLASQFVFILSLHVHLGR